MQLLKCVSTSKSIWRKESSSKLAFSQEKADLLEVSSEEWEMSSEEWEMSSEEWEMSSEQLVISN